MTVSKLSEYQYVALSTDVKPGVDGTRRERWHVHPRVRGRRDGGDHVVFDERDVAGELLTVEDNSLEGTGTATVALKTPSFPPGATSGAKLIETDTGAAFLFTGTGWVDVSPLARAEA